jgi:4'-phosphopantetheinyl transferase
VNDPPLARVAAGGLSGAQVHVWRACVDPPPARAGPIRALLDAAESRRAEAFLDPARSWQFVAGRAMLRQLLSGYLGVEPAAVQLETAAGGKPRLAGAHAGSGLQFNLSHSRGVVVVAVGVGRRVGVDVEFCRPDLDVERLARRFFSPAELEQLLGLPASQRPAAFYAGWTRKEAYLKARGDGVAGGLRHFAVALRPGLAPALLACPGGLAEQRRWRLATLDGPPGYAGALCAEGADWHLCTGAWDVVAPTPRVGPSGR